MVPTDPKASRVGILGGGQLSLFLAQAALKLNLSPLAWASSGRDPVSEAPCEVVLADWNDQERILDFFRRVDVVIFENEFVPYAQLGSLGPDMVAKFRPALSVMEMLSDKVEQKRLLERLRIGTATHFIWDEEADLDSWLDVCLRRFENRCVLKWARFGYDGLGTRVWTGENRESIKEFCRTARSKKTNVFAEAYVQFRRELAMVASVVSAEEIVCYPLVVSEQRNGVCHKVWGPAVDAGVDGRVQTLAIEWVCRLVFATGIVGTFALEFFETQIGSLFVNEIAPRVHNSGHYSLDASLTSQFENHLRAVVGLPLGPTDSRGPFAMVNCLGPEGVRRILNRNEVPLVPEGAHLHWYGKRESRPGRKMGHLTVWAPTPTSMDNLLHPIEKAVKDWQLRLGDV